MKRTNAPLRTLLLLLVLATLCFSCTAALASDAKTLTVGSGQEFTTIQAAIDHVAAQDDPTGWTINVKAGEYNRFYVKSGIEGLTITAAANETVVVNVIDGNTDQSAIYGTKIAGSECGTQCCLIRGSDITLSNLTFRTKASQLSWMDAAVALYTSGKVTIENCVFDGTATGDGYGIFIQNNTGKFTVTGCTFDTLDQAIWGENSGRWPEAISITNNVFKNCSFAIHFGYNAGSIITDKKLDPAKKENYSSAGNYFNITDNTIIGTESLRNKIVFQDSYDVDMCSVTVSGNELTYGLIGLVNIANPQLTTDLLQDNSFGEDSFVVEAQYDYANNTEKVGVYMADKDAYGKWILMEGNGLENQAFYPLIVAAVEAANEAGSKELQITGLDGNEDVLYTFTWYKDAIYWETLPAPTPTPTTVPTPTPTPVPTPTPRPASSLPKTGDDTPLFGAALCLLLSAAAVFALTYRRRRV